MPNWLRPTTVLEYRYSYGQGEGGCEPPLGSSPREAEGISTLGLGGQQARPGTWNLLLLALPPLVTVNPGRKIVAWWDVGAVLSSFIFVFQDSTGRSARTYSCSGTSTVQCTVRYRRTVPVEQGKILHRSIIFVPCQSGEEGSRMLLTRNDLSRRAVPRVISLCVCVDCRSTS